MKSQTCKEARRSYSRKETFNLALLIGAAFCTLLFVQPTAHSAPGDLYVSEPANGVIVKFAPDGTKSTFVSGRDSPRELAFDGAGNLFVSEGAQPGNIVKITPSGEITVFASGLSIPGGLAFDGSGNLFVAETFGDVGDILKFTPEGTKSLFVGFGNLHTNLAFDTSGTLFAATWGPTDFDGEISKITPQGEIDEVSFFGGPAIAFDSAGTLYFTGLGGIVKIPGGEFISDLQGVTALAFDDAGNLFAVQADAIIKISPDATRTTFASGLNQPSYLVFEPVLEKLRNISARGLVGTGNDVLIGGFIVGGNALANNAVLLRAIGPSLSDSGVSNPLADPTLELQNASGMVIATNDDWQDTQQDQINATGIPPTDPKESAIYATLPAGNYTAVVRGAGDTTGTALVEVYVLE